MRVLSVDIENVRSIRQLKWEVAEEHAAGWHVILGDNGSGKSSCLRAIALALVGPEDVYGLRQSGDDWLRRGTDSGSIGVVFSRDPEFDQLVGGGRAPNAYGSCVRIERLSANDVIARPADRESAPTDVRLYPPDEVTLRIDTDTAVRGKSADRTVWNPSARGWFAAGFGPFRRFSGGEGDSEQLAKKLPRLARYLSLFDERFALFDALEWLVGLKFAELSGQGQLFGKVRSFINQPGFLPHGVQLVDVEPPKRVLFEDAAGARVPIEELSDGFRAILSMTFELMRHFVLAYGEERVFGDSALTVGVPGVVLIDEVDAHLHPTWQRRIGTWFVRAFPNVQFVVTTHSPLVCQSADRGSIFVLPAPGEEGSGAFLDGQEKARLVFGNVLDALGTGAFGTNVGQSEAGREKLERLAALNAKELDTELTTPEVAERSELRAILPSRAATTG